MRHALDVLDDPVSKVPRIHFPREVDVVALGKTHYFLIFLNTLLCMLLLVAGVANSVALAPALSARLIGQGLKTYLEAAFLYIDQVTVLHVGEGDGAVLGNLLHLHVLA